MRYNDRVEIITKKQEEYDPEIGEYTFSEDKGCSKVLYFQNAPKIAFTYLNYRKERYKCRADKQSGRVFYLEKDNSIG